ncbi:MAG: acetyl-CoA carboxylase carboxyltransferase subunit beta [Alphaproteobacteria bacterium]|nr:MAG: acetyl-CoA carboxylase carboxyltransferase subunit beta [Alphaproteobacteria bacterium]
MNWLTDFVRPRLKALMGQKNDIPEDLWHKCPACEKLIFHRDLEANIHVCHHCDHHLRLNAKDRLRFLFDGATYTRIALPPSSLDPLKFRDLKKYADRLKQARTENDMDDAVCVAEGKIEGQALVVAVFDFNFMGGSMGVAAGEALVVGAQHAVHRKLPYLVITASGGARMQEGILSLMQMPRATIGVSMVKDAGLPYITVLTDPTTGGVSASFAMLGDIIMAEPKALIAFTGARVIKQTIRAELPEGFQRSEYLLEHGMIDRVVHRKHLRRELATVLKVLLP